jgi:predicted metal-dependent hydrolase
MEAIEPLLFCCEAQMQLGLPFDAQGQAPLEFYYVRHRRARRYVVRVDADGRVRVTIPRGGSRREADAFAQRQIDWIRGRVEEYREARTARPDLSSEEKRRLRAIARATLAPRLLELAACHGLTVTRVSIRDQRSRWGSCGRDGHICLNWRLVQMPDSVRDYVLIHELMHLRRMDHSAKYWRLVAAACPDYQAARQWLRRHGPALR